MEILIAEGGTKHVWYFDENKLWLTIFRLFRLGETCEEKYCKFWKREENLNYIRQQRMQNLSFSYMYIGSWKNVENENLCTSIFR